MIKIEQAEVDSETGDCMRASIASILDADLMAVPHFTRTCEHRWFTVMYYFFISYGYKYSGIWYPVEGRRKLLKKHSIDGFYLASVNSKTYDKEIGITHMVVIDADFNVAHDPHPDKKWQGENLLGDENFNSVYLFRKMGDIDRQYWHYL